MNPSVIKPNNLIIITPNHREFNLLKECAGCSTSCLEECLMKISAYFKNSVIVLKGKEDYICCGSIGIEIIKVFAH